MPKEQNFSGQTIGDFLFLEKVYKGPKGSRYKVQCLCGKTRIITAHYARRKSRGYCTCKHFRETKDICLDQLFQRYKYGSAHRAKKMKFLISKENL